MIQGDTFQKFLFDELQIRGEWVRLDKSFQSAVENKNYPAKIRNLLGETTVAALLLTGTLKFTGQLSIHARGSGPVGLLMAEATDQRYFRTIANYDETLPETDSLQHLLGDAQLAITIDPERGSRYQGIVPLEKDQMDACLEQYFEMSEQLATYLYIWADESACFGLLLQKLPDQGEQEDADAWGRVIKLAETLTPEECRTLSNEALTYRLFNEERVSLFPEHPVAFRCSCSRERTLASIQALGREEALNILESEAVISVDCQFCGSHYAFNRADVLTLFGLDGLQ